MNRTAENLYLYPENFFEIPLMEYKADKIVELLKPESDLERLIIADHQFQEGLFWGKPRYGHPEGAIIYHIKEVFENIDKLDVSKLLRQQLRLIALVHDTFKSEEAKHRKKGTKRDWSKHHAVYATKFLEKYSEDKAVLDVIELHDEAFYAWRMQNMYEMVPEGKMKLQYLLERLGKNLQLYYLFFKCDTKTGDKNQAPLKWFESTIKGIQIVEF